MKPTHSPPPMTTWVPYHFPLKTICTIRTECSKNSKKKKGIITRTYQHWNYKALFPGISEDEANKFTDTHDHPTTLPSSPHTILHTMRTRCSKNMEKNQQQINTPISTQNYKALFPDKWEDEANKFIDTHDHPTTLPSSPHTILHTIRQDAAKTWTRTSNRSNTPINTRTIKHCSLVNERMKPTNLPTLMTTWQHYHEDKMQHKLTQEAMKQRR